MDPSTWRLAAHLVAILTICLPDQALADRWHTTASSRIGLGVGVRGGSGAGFELEANVGPMFERLKRTQYGAEPVFWLIPELGYTLTVDEMRTHHLGSAGFRWMGGGMFAAVGGQAAFLAGAVFGELALGGRLGLLLCAVVGLTLEISYQFLKSGEATIHGLRFVFHCDWLWAALNL